MKQYGIFSDGMNTLLGQEKEAIAAVCVLVFAIMHYEMGKINKKNLIVTIQNENI